MESKFKNVSFEITSPNFNPTHCCKGSFCYGSNYTPAQFPKDLCLIWLTEVFNEQWSVIQYFAFFVHWHCFGPYLLSALIKHCSEDTNYLFSHKLFAVRLEYFEGSRSAPGRWRACYPQYPNTTSYLRSCLLGFNSCLRPRLSNGTPRRQIVFFTGCPWKYRQLDIIVLYLCSRGRSKSVAEADVW